MASVHVCRDERITCRQVLINFVRHRMRQAGMDRNVVDAALGPLFEEMRYEEMNAVTQIIAFADIVENNANHREIMMDAITNVDVYRECGRQNYYVMLNNMFTDGMIGWGRLSMVVTYTGELVMRALRDGRHQRVTDVIDWCTTFLGARFFSDWLEAQGGWEGMPQQIYTGRQQQAGIQQVAQVENEEPDGGEQPLRDLFMGTITIAGVMAAGMNILNQN